MKDGDKMKLKKNSFMQGAFIAALGIVLTKIMGILYVIPFYAMIGEQGGALYGYAYNIYSVFLGIATAGIPLAVSKLTSEYNTLGYYEAKERAFKLSKLFLTTVGIICFIILFIFSKDIAYLILGDITGGNTIEDVTFVIRTISTAILIIPTVSVYRGYFQGHKYITPTSISQVLEQIVRVTIIIGGGYLLKSFGFSTKEIVACALIAATIGGVTSYLYLLIKRRSNNDKFPTAKSKKTKDAEVTNKEIFKKIFMYALPFIMIDLFKSLYNSVDIAMLVKALVNRFNYSIDDAESIMSVISVWGNKLNMIVSAAFTGVTTSLIPSLTVDFVKQNKKGVSEKINKAYKLVTFVALPMVVGLSFLVEPVWNVFYGTSTYGPIVYRYFVFVALLSGLFSTTVIIVQVLKEYKVVFLSLISGILIKIILNIPLLYVFDYFGLPAFYGSTTASLFGFGVGILISTISISKKHEISYKSFFKQFVNILFGVVVMVIVLCILKFFLTITNLSRIKAIFVILTYAIVGMITYFTVMFKTKTIHNIFGCEKVNKLTDRILNRKK